MTGMAVRKDVDTVSSRTADRRVVRRARRTHRRGSWFPAVVAAVAAVAAALVWQAGRPKRGSLGPEEASAPFTAAQPTSFLPTVENKGSAPGPALAGMVWIPGGEFSMGAADRAEMNPVGMQATVDSRPIHRVYVDGFWMDETEVTNEQFEKFVRSTGYVTIAEHTPTKERVPNGAAGNPRRVAVPEFGARNRTQGVTILLTAAYQLKSLIKMPEHP